MKLVYRPIDVWPGELTPDSARNESRFEASWTNTLKLLESEVRNLARPGVEPEVVLQVAGTERDMRLDGSLRADARPSHPGVVISFESRHGPLRYSTDAFRSSEYLSGRRFLVGWQANVRAIALGLEALRRVDRYGIARGGEQYRGWQALPPGISMPAAQMSVEDAARFIADQAWPGAEIDEQEVLDDPVVAYRLAAKRLHPDVGGDAELFKRLQEARLVIEGFNR